MKANTITPCSVPAIDWDIWGWLFQSMVEFIIIPIDGGDGRQDWEL